MAFWYLLHLMVPVAAAWSLALAVASPAPVNAVGLALLCCGVLLAYVGDRWRERRQDWSRLGRAAALITCSLAAVAAVVLLACRLQLWWVCLGLAVITLAYPLAQRWWFSKLLSVVLCWTVAVTLLPAAEPDWRLLVSASTLVVALILTIAVILCDVKDVQRDHLQRTDTLVLHMAPHRLRQMLRLLAVAALAVMVVKHQYLCLSALLPLVIFVDMPFLMRHPLAGPLLVDGSLVLPGVWLCVRELL